MNNPERRTALIAQELARYNVDIVVLGETRFVEEGQLTRIGGWLYLLLGGQVGLVLLSKIELTEI